MPRHLLKISDLSPEEFKTVLDRAVDIKANEEKYQDALKQKTLLMMFQKPSLRTHISYETGMTKLGGHAIYYSVANGPLSNGKESVMDTSKVVSRMVDVVAARLNSRHDMAGLAEHASVPCINMLDDLAHPAQMCADFLTIREVKGSFEGLKMAFIGDIQNNVTYDIMRACALLGMECAVSGPDTEEFHVEQSVFDEVDEICKKTGAKVYYTADPVEAAKDCDVIYNDTWLSYHLDPSAKETRKAVLMPYQVNAELVSHCKDDFIFMNCLPLEVGIEVTADVCYDEKHSVIYQEAENRMWGQMGHLYELFHGCLKE